ncbi:MAG TPA: transketolase C-terminal domain-containing protein [Humidesulfovibrio sp.]|uniref:transketolase family protein n=1 Tax=Humidesulfovibrio sp. TaxID=2910988 RepID=UPI002CF81AA4|nr:transketolase C-terminal domain-containing protein [Humidesulfovibrio sp.]HWR03888.1 transketolase C-terminal domain-containing protein [Humidesulfovibrio sp.]
MRGKCLNMVHKLAKEDERIVFLGSDLGFGTLKQFREELPERFIMEGINEAHAIGMAAGLAFDGRIVYVNTIATFLTRRSYEQVALDLCLHKANVRLIGNGGGMVYAPLGSTHLAIEDIAIMRALPNMAIVAVADAEEMERLMPQTVDWQGPLYIRLAKGYDPIVSDPAIPFVLGKGMEIQRGADVLLVATGVTLGPAKEAAKLLAETGVSCGILHMHTVKPFDTALFLDMAQGVRAVISVEEHTILGGLGSAVAEILAETPFARQPRFKRLGIPDVFPDKYGTQNQLMARYGIDTETIVGTAKALLA